MKIKVNGTVTAEQFAKRAFYLAWQACGGPMGMGVFRDHGPGMTEEQVVSRAVNAGDYGGPLPGVTNRAGEIYGDYVFGRMSRWKKTKWSNHESLCHH